MITFRNTLNKVVETADIVSHLIKNTKSSSAKIKKSVHYSSTNGNTATLLNSINTPKTIKSFKAGGIVATAVQNKRFLKKSSQQLLSQIKLPLVCEFGQIIHWEFLTFNFLLLSRISQLVFYREFLIDSC